MATSDVIGGGNIEPRGLEEEMRSSYLDYAMSVIVGRALPDVRDGLKPVHRRVLFSMNENGLQPNRRHVKSLAHRRRRDGQVPPARRPGDLRHAGAPRAGLLDAQHAGRRPGQLRLDRRRPSRGDALHGGAAGAAGARDDARPRRGHGRLPAQLRRREPRADGAAVAFPEPAGQRLLGHRGGHGDEHPAAQPARDDRRDQGVHRRPRHRRAGPHAPHQGPRLPDRRDDPRPDRHPRRVRDRARAHPRAGAGAQRAARPRARRRSSSPSCPSWSRRAATTA